MIYDFNFMIRYAKVLKINESCKYFSKNIPRAQILQSKNVPYVHFYTRKTIRAMKKLNIFALVAMFVALAVTACKATRTVTSTATYTEVTDSGKVTTTISTKTVEDYQGVKKN